MELEASGEMGKWGNGVEDHRGLLCLCRAVAGAMRISAAVRRKSITSSCKWSVIRIQGSYRDGRLAEDCRMLWALDYSYVAVVCASRWLAFSLSLKSTDQGRQEHKRHWP